MQDPGYYFCPSSALQASSQGKDRHPFMATAIPGPGPAGQGLGGVPSYMDYECYDYKPSSDSEVCIYITSQSYYSNLTLIYNRIKLCP